MSEIEGIYAVWLREAKIYMREKERLVSAIISPLLWIFAFGAGLSPRVDVEGYSYQVFIYPGIIVMTVLFTSLFYGIYIIWDRKLDFLKEVLVAPVSRAGVFAGKMLGGATDAMVQAVFLLIIGIFIAVPLTALIIIEAFFMWPMFFFSGALFPVNDLAAWLTAVTFINPLTYGVDAVRGIMLGINNFPIYLDVAVMLLFSLVMMGIGILSFRRM